MAGDEERVIVPGIPTAAVSRLVTYLRILEDLERAQTLTTSSGALAGRAQVSAFQVRKDLAYFGRFGTRGMGYTVSVLKRELTRVLGLNRSWNVVIVGMGRLGQAIAHYPGASEYQFGYVGLFDVKADLIGQHVDVPAQREQAGVLGQAAPPRQLRTRHIRDLADFAEQQRSATAGHRYGLPGGAARTRPECGAVTGRGRHQGDSQLRAHLNSAAAPKTAALCKRSVTSGVM